MILVAAIAVLEPLQLGGFEIHASVSLRPTQQMRSMGGRTEARQRLLHSAQQIAPVYLAATALLTVRGFGACGGCLMRSPELLPG